MQIKIHSFLVKRNNNLALCLEPPVFVSLLKVIICSNFGKRQKQGDLNKHTDRVIVEEEKHLWIPRGVEPEYRVDISLISQGKKQSLFVYIHV